MTGRLGEGIGRVQYWDCRSQQQPDFSPEWPLMRIDLDDTIAALASAAGSAARGIVRLSGADVQSVLARLFVPIERPHDGVAGVDQRKPPASAPSGGCAPKTPLRPQPPRRSHARRHPGLLHLPEFRTPVPAALYLWPDSRSYTGQPAAELHLPGSPPLLEAVLAALYAQGARPARPGEFTLRAFLAGKIDLVQAEAVLGVIDADDQPRLKTALSQLAGGVSGKIDAVRSDLLNLLADLEAGLDFVDEDIEFVSRNVLLDRIAAAREALADLLVQAASRMLSTGRRNVVVAGLPNAGKSTLFNALAGGEAALVSETSGTTRDYLSAECDWNGTAINLIDTAGWEQTGDELSAAAQTQRARQLERADLVLWCTAANLPAARQADNLRSRQEVIEAGCPVLDVQTKIDLAAEASTEGVRVSATKRIGLDDLIARADANLSRDAGEGQELVGTTAARCRESLETAIEALDGAGAAGAGDTGNEIVAVDLRDSLGHLGRIVGRIYTDDILDRVFSRFCIGK